ncbi:DUF1754-domain-containing protein [Lindgomyces ingoldianus]|uniref:DUF1754-domain-containing protein n=1 Tax=Lindgomyces ingoldianus TaxID=673940 RepID=A0ACB6QTI2_9PLEO|nr:DUF1754-domain-containing protein [Lindgomyces ingoldianus]KAF2470162.1 DUF1754-domain-containing protein [Lindgomyces ingoldianus]
MTSSDYTTASGGALKLKGSSGIEKKKKKKKKKKKPATDSDPTLPVSASTESKLSSESNTPKEHTSASATPQLVSPKDFERELRESGGRQKTEAEKRHEERRRKMLDERLKREGVKTHKERVEELNRYLSGLSEHHDMPKIGPG